MELDQAEQQMLQLQLPDLHLINVVDGPDGDDDDMDIDMDIDIQELPLNNPRVAMLLDAPHEPPMDMHQMVGPVHVPLQPRKKRSLFTISKPLEIQPEMCALISNGMRAMEEAHPENPAEFFANYLNEHMNSQNYPNGVGLPHRWGQF